MEQRRKLASWSLLFAFGWLSIQAPTDSFCAPESISFDAIRLISPSSFDIAKSFAKFSSPLALKKSLGREMKKNLGSDLLKESAQEVTAKLVGVFRVVGSFVAEWVLPGVAPIVGATPGSGREGDRSAGAILLGIAQRLASSEASQAGFIGRVKSAFSDRDTFVSLLPSSSPAFSRQVLKLSKGPRTYSSRSVDPAASLSERFLDGSTFKERNPIRAPRASDIHAQGPPRGPGLTQDPLLSKLLSSSSPIPSDSTRLSDLASSPISSKGGVLSR